MLLSIAFAGDCQNYFCEYAKSCRVLTDSILAELGINGRPAIITSTENALTETKGFSIYVKEEDGLLLVDYKTDQAESGEELLERYRIQIRYYARALEQLTGEKVKEAVLYSLRFQKEFSVEGPW